MLVDVLDLLMISSDDYRTRPRAAVVEDYSVRGYRCGGRRVREGTYRLGTSKTGMTSWSFRIGKDGVWSRPVVGREEGGDFGLAVDSRLKVGCGAYAADGARGAVHSSGFSRGL